jgi:hypothetical protein
MRVPEVDVRRAKKRMQARLVGQPRATFARYDRRDARIVVGLSNGLELGLPVERAQGLAGARATDLADIEISPTGFGLHWPRLDADLYVPALMEGLFSARRWMARANGKVRGHSTFTAKQKAARASGGLAGRPRKWVHA